MDLKQKLRSPNETLGLEICSTPNGIRIFCCHLKKQKDSIHLLESTELTSKDLKAYLEKKNMGFRLFFSGKGVLTQANTVVKTDDFLSQEYKQQTHLIRKDSISSDILELTNKVKYGGIILGNSPLCWAHDFLSLKQLHSFCYDLQSTRANWELDAQEVELSGETVNSTFIGAYLTGVSLFFENAISTATATETSSYYENNFLKNSLVCFGILLLMIAVLNFFVFDYLNSQNSALSTSNQSTIELSEEYETLQKEIKLKTQLMTELGISKKQSLSFYSDRIAYSVPQSIVVNQCNIVTLDEVKYKKETVLDFNRNQIHVSGYTDSAIDFNNWLGQLKEFDWLTKVEVENYKFDSQNGHSLFNLTIILK